MVVLASIILHGTTATPLAAWYGRAIKRSSLPEEILTSASGLLSTGEEWADGISRIAPAELLRRIESGDPITILDVRRAQAFDSSELRIPGAIRVTLDDLSARLATLPKGPPIALYCA